MSTSYIPPRDADLLSWSLNFATLIAASPATYGLMSSDAAAITVAQTLYSTDYAIAISPSTRTPQSIQAKDTSKVQLLATVRPYAQQVANNAGVSSSLKISLGLNGRTNTPTPVAAPTSNPVLVVQSALPYQHILRYRDALVSPSVKAKPANVTQAQIYAMVSVTPVTDPALLSFLGVNTKSPFAITWDSSNVGKQAYYAARWQTRTGLVGPWSPIISFTVAG